MMDFGVYNMDCLEGLKEIPDSFVDLIVTDPPYEVNYDKKSQELAKLDKSREDQVARDSHFIDTIPDYDLLAREFFRVLKPDSHCYLFCGDRQIVKWSLAMTSAGFKAPQVLVWKKNKTTFDMTFGYKYPENKEFILFFQKGWKRLNGWDVERACFRSVLNFDSADDCSFHSCTKPLDLLNFLVKASSKEGDVCLDAFAGSGNHLISFYVNNRSFIGFEISPVYHSWILERLAIEKSQQRLRGVFP